MVAGRSLISELRALFGPDPTDASEPLRILAFEVAAAMARLVSLHRFLSDAELRRLRGHTLRSEGVACLVSPDQARLLRLACTELLTDLDSAASVAARLSTRCRADLPRRFPALFAEAKADGLAQLSQLGLAKPSARRIKKMERLVAVTASLYAEMDALNVLEASERRMAQWRRNSGPIPMGKPDATEPLRRELETQRTKVRRLMENSLWNVTFDRAVAPMAKAALAILARISAVFGEVVPGLPPLSVSKIKRSSGPLPTPAWAGTAISHSAPLFQSRHANCTPLESPASTLGSCGMALRYANVIIAAEKQLALKLGMWPADDHEPVMSREELYDVLPGGVQSAVKTRLREYWRSEAAAVDGARVEVWRGEVERILRWLGPMARDTTRWHEEHSMDLRRRFETGPRSLRLQTLHFADRQKAEAVVVDVLVGLSCMCRHDELLRGSLES